MIYENFKARYTRVTRKLKRQQFARKKLIIITYHEKDYSKRSIVNKFKIKSKQLHNQIKNKKKLISVISYIQKLNIDVCSKFSHFEDEFMKWFTEAKDQLKTVT